MKSGEQRTLQTEEKIGTCGQPSRSGGSNRDQSHKQTRMRRASSAEKEPQPTARAASSEAKNQENQTLYHGRFVPAATEMDTSATNALVTDTQRPKQKDCSDSDSQESPQADSCLLPAWKQTEKSNGWTHLSSSTTQTTQERWNRSRGQPGRNWSQCGQSEESSPMPPAVQATTPNEQTSSTATGNGKSSGSNTTQQTAPPRRDQPTGPAQDHLGESSERSGRPGLAAAAGVDTTLVDPAESTTLNKARLGMEDLQQAADPRPSLGEKTFAVRSTIDGHMLLLHNYQENHEVADSVMRDVYSLRSTLRLYLEHHKQDLEKWYGGGDRGCYFNGIVTFLEDAHTLMHRPYPWMDIMSIQRMLSENRRVNVLPHMREAVKMAMETGSDIQQVIEFTFLSMGIKELGDGAKTGGSVSRTFRLGLVFQIFEDLWLPTTRLRGSILAIAEQLTRDQTNWDNMQMRQACADVRRTRTSACKMTVQIWEWRRHQLRNAEGLPANDSSDEGASTSSWLEVNSNDSSEGRVANAVNLLQQNICSAKGTGEPQPILFEPTLAYYHRFTVYLENTYFGKHLSKPQILVRLEEKAAELRYKADWGLLNAVSALPDDHAWKPELQLLMNNSLEDLFERTGLDDCPLGEESIARLLQLPAHDRETALYMLDWSLDAMRRSVDEKLQEALEKFDAFKQQISEIAATPPAVQAEVIQSTTMEPHPRFTPSVAHPKRWIIRCQQGQEVVWPGRTIAETTKKSLRLPMPIIRILVAQIGNLPNGVNKELMMKKWGDEIRSRTAAFLNASILAAQAGGKKALSHSSPLSNPQMADILDRTWPYLCPSPGCGVSFKEKVCQKCRLCKWNVSPIHKDEVETYATKPGPEGNVWIRKPSTEWTPLGETPSGRPPTGAVPLTQLYTSAATPAVPLEQLHKEGMLMATDLMDAVRVDEHGKEIVPDESGYAFHPALVEAAAIKQSLQIIQECNEEKQDKKEISLHQPKEVTASQMEAHGPSVMTGIAGIRMSLLDMMKNWLLLMNYAHRLIASPHSVQDIEAEKFRLANESFHDQVTLWNESKEGPAKIQDWIARLQKLYDTTAKQSLPHLSEALKVEAFSAEKKVLHPWRYTELRGKQISLFNILGEVRTLMAEPKVAPLCKQLPVTSEVWEVACLVPRREVLQCMTQPAVHKVCGMGVELWNMLKDDFVEAIGKGPSFSFQDLMGNKHKWFADTTVECSAGKISYSSVTGQGKGEVQCSLKDYNAAQAKKRKLPAPKAPSSSAAAGVDMGEECPKAKARNIQQNPLETAEDVSKLMPEKDSDTVLDALVARATQDAKDAPSSSECDWGDSDTESVKDADVEEAIQLEAMQKGMEEAKQELISRGCQPPETLDVSSTVPKRLRTSQDPTTPFRESLDACVERLRSISGSDCASLQEAVMARAREDPKVAEFFDKADKERQKRIEIAEKLEQKKKEWQPQAQDPSAWSQEMQDALHALYDKSRCAMGHADAVTSYAAWHNNGSPNHCYQVRQDALTAIKQCQRWLAVAKDGSRPEWVPYWNEKFFNGEFPPNADGNQPASPQERVEQLVAMVGKFKGKSAALPWRWKLVEPGADSPEALKNRDLLSELDYLFPGLKSAKGVNDFNKRIKLAKHLHDIIHAREKKAWVRRGNKEADWVRTWSLDKPPGSVDTRSPLLRADPADEGRHWELEYTRVDFLWLATMPDMSPRWAYEFMLNLPSMPGGQRGSMSQDKRRKKRTEELQEAMAKAKDWAAARGLEEPKTAGDYKVLLQVVTKELGTLDYIMKNPSWIDELPDLPGCDPEADLFTRADYDHRISFPIELLPDDIIKELHNKKGLAVVFRYFRCPRLVDVQTATAEWGKVECGLLLPAVTGWDYSRHASGAKNRYKCKFCTMLWKGEQGHLLEIYDGVVLISLILDSPPQREYDAWAKERVKLYRKFEPTGALLDAVPKKIEGVTPKRIRLRNEASNHIWRVILSGGSNALSAGLMDSVKQEAMKEAMEMRQTYLNLPATNEPVR